MKACIHCRQFEVEERLKKIGRCRVDKGIHGFYDGFGCPSYEEIHRRYATPPIRDSLLSKVIAREYRNRYGRYPDER